MDFDLLKLNVYNAFVITLGLMDINTLVIITLGLTGVILNLIKIKNLLKGKDEEGKEIKKGH